MFTRQYKVKGDDVNDFMVMQNAAYLKYGSKLLETFLFVNGFTNLKRNTLKVGIENRNDNLLQFKPLFFTNSFLMTISFKNVAYLSNKMEVEINFFNSKDELTATLHREILWFDYENFKPLTPPKKILNFFNKQDFKKVG